MNTLQINNLPDELYQSIKKHAIATSMSFNDAVLQILTQGINATPDNLQAERTRETLASIRSFPRKNPADYGLPDSTKLIREDRDR